MEKTLNFTQLLWARATQVVRSTWKTRHSSFTLLSQRGNVALKELNWRTSKVLSVIRYVQTHPKCTHFSVVRLGCWQRDILARKVRWSSATLLRRPAVTLASLIGPWPRATQSEGLRLLAAASLGLHPSLQHPGTEGQRRQIMAGKTDTVAFATSELWCLFSSF